MKEDIDRPVKNEEGFVFVVCILLLFVLTIAGIATVRTSGTELLTVRNQGQIIREFYQAETGMIDAFENPVWLTDNTFMTADPSDPDNAKSGPHETKIDGRTVAKYDVRCIEGTGTAMNGLTPFENNVPVMQHIGPPPINQGYSLQYFEIRRYAITARSASGNSIVQGGVWKVFNKFN